MWAHNLEEWWKVSFIEAQLAMLEGRWQSTIPSIRDDNIQDCANAESVRHNHAIYKNCFLANHQFVLWGHQHIELCSSNIKQDGDWGETTYWIGLTGSIVNNSLHAVGGQLMRGWSSFTSHWPISIQSFTYTHAIVSGSQIYSLNLFIFAHPPPFLMK